MDMPYDEYWNGDCCAVKAYRDAYELKQRNKNQELWLQGLYVHEAVSIALGNAFRKKGASPMKYTEHPYPVTPLERREQKEAEEKRNYEIGIAKMKAIMLGVNARLAEKKGGGGKQ